MKHRRTAVSDITLAFEHPEARAAATVGAPTPPDRISLRDHVVEVEIGAFQSERGTTQRVCFNVVVEVAPPVAPLDDDVDRILSYDTITDAIALELKAERLNLLETLAERIAKRILLAPQALRVFVRVEKLDRGPGALGVEIVRSREQVQPHVQAPEEKEAVPHPLVIYLSNAAVHSPRLSAWIDELEAAGWPAIFCVGPADLPAPVAAAPAAQRRIDLLAIEQNAWVLAGRDRRCVVVGSRTELDWAARHRRFSVWAPSKIVLDSVESPGVEARDAAALALWFAGVVSAGRAVFIGEAAPEGAGLPVVSLPAESPGIVQALPRRG